MAKMNSQQFAANVRAKFPGAYDNIPDEDLTQKVLLKYPQYNSVVEGGPTQPSLPIPSGLQGPPAPPAKPGVVQRFATNFNSGFGVPESVQQNPMEGVQGLKMAVSHPSTLGASLQNIGSNAVDAQSNLAGQGLYQMKQPGVLNKVGGATNLVLSGVPVVGPAIANAGQQLFKNGDIAGGLGSTAALVSQLASAHPTTASAIADMPGRAASSVPKIADSVMHPIDAAKNSVVPVADKLALGKNPAEILTRATKPTVGLPEYEASLNRAIPDLAKANPRSLDQLASAADSIRDNNWMKYTDMKSQFAKPEGAGPYNPARVDANPVADAQVASIPATDLFEKPNQQSFIQRGSRMTTQGDPGILEKTKSVADLYRTDMPVEQADSIVRDTNGKLRNFYNKAGGDQAAALTNPETARTFAVNNTLRSQLYDTIQNGTGVDPQPLMQKYGDAVDIGDTAGRRNTVFSRQQPNPLATQINYVNAGVNPVKWAMSKMFSHYNDSNVMVGKAFDIYGRNRAGLANGPGMASATPPTTGAAPAFLGSAYTPPRRRK